MVEPRVRHTVGLSVGPPSETSGLAVIETSDRTHAVRHLQRFTPGTAYSEIVLDVEKVLESLHDPVVVVDVTAVGAPIAERFRWSRASDWHVVLTAGERDTSRSPWRLPRLDVAAEVQIALQEGRLSIAKQRLAAELARDLRTFNPRPSAGAASELAWRDRPSDDLVLAVAVALVEADRPPACITVVPIHRPRRWVV